MDNQQISDLHLAQGEACDKAYPSNKVKGADNLTYLKIDVLRVKRRVNNV